MDVLAADIGGTRARLATFRIERGERPRLLRHEERPTSGLDGLESYVRAFMLEGREQLRSACFAVAGPVHRGRVRLSNADIEVGHDRLRAATGIEDVRLINDFLAVAHAVPALQPDEVLTLHEGKPVETGITAVVGAGTGLGVAYIDHTVDPPTIHDSEGGHAEFAPREPVQQDLAAYLAARYGRVSWERILSGAGLADVYRFLGGESSVGTEPDGGESRPHGRDGREDDPAIGVTRRGVAGTDARAVRALHLFSRVYGAFAANVALMLGARRGVFVAGGIAPRIHGVLSSGAFADAFLDVGRMRGYVAPVPVRLVVREDVGLLGAAIAAAPDGPFREPRHTVLE